MFALWENVKRHVSPSPFGTKGKLTAQVRPSRNAATGNNNPATTKTNDDGKHEKHDTVTYYFRTDYPSYVRAWDSESYAEDDESDTDPEREVEKVGIDSVSEEEIRTIDPVPSYGHEGDDETVPRTVCSRDYVPGLGGPHDTQRRRFNEFLGQARERSEERVRRFGCGDWSAVPAPGQP
jgi:hypothetical protein